MKLYFLQKAYLQNFVLNVDFCSIRAVQRMRRRKRRRKKGKKRHLRLSGRWYYVDVRFELKDNCVRVCVCVCVLGKRDGEAEDLVPTGTAARPRRS